MHIKANNSPAVSLVQITDAHLERHRGGTLLGMDTDASLAAVVALIARERGECDVLLATGDISNCGAVTSYQRFAEATATVASRRHWLPGNHDLNSAMEEAVGRGDQLQRVVDIGNWRLVLLDSSVDGESGGLLAPAELAHLTAALADCGQRHVLIAMHHPLLAIDCAWLDPQKVVNSEQFFAIVEGCDRVRGVICGHIHQPIDRVYRGLRLLASPSSCVQFAPGSDDFRLQRVGPGYRWLTLGAEGTIDTGMSRVENYPFESAIDFEGEHFY
ncbi:MAG: Icc protein [Paraglaciecola psychrophila]|jgi:Icc protein